MKPTNAISLPGSWELDMGLFRLPTVVSRGSSRYLHCHPTGAEVYFLSSEPSNCPS
ncbi:hypothetical protein CGRA01v4_07341 [Colletotrichum graminicola]|nr:hypothetical protein CGRA01v4_07341 [Colletotrichum graminicola]